MGPRCAASPPPKPVGEEVGETQSSSSLGDLKEGHSPNNDEVLVPAIWVFVYLCVPCPAVVSGCHLTVSSPSLPSSSFLPRQAGKAFRLKKCDLGSRKTSTCARACIYSHSLSSSILKTIFFFYHGRTFSLFLLLVNSLSLSS